MGTNTDPYQRAEAKYRLKRGVLETLTERANPFGTSIGHPDAFPHDRSIAQGWRCGPVCARVSLGEVARTTS